MIAGSRVVLVADDDDEFRALLAEYLTSRGFEVLQAANGLEALLHVKRNVLKAVVMDIAMPRLGGLEAIKRIRAFTPATRIVVVTGQTDPDLDARARALGAAAVVFKPVDLANLLSAVIGEAVASPAVASPARPPAAAAPVPAPAAAGATWPRGRLLLVDDDETFREMLEEFLASRGYDVRSVSDAATALRVIEHAPPDVMLLDIEMPGLNGIQALPTIRAVAPKTVVVMVSGTADEAIARRALIYGAFDYVTKPVDIVYLARSIDAALMTKALDA